MIGFLRLLQVKNAWMRGDVFVSLHFCKIFKTFTSLVNTPFLEFGGLDSIGIQLVDDHLGRVLLPVQLVQQLCLVPFAHLKELRIKLVLFWNLNIFLSEKKSEIWKYRILFHFEDFPDFWIQALSILANSKKYDNETILLFLQFEIRILWIPWRSDGWFSSHPFPGCPLHPLQWATSRRSSTDRLCSPLHNEWLIISLQVKDKILLLMRVLMALVFFFSSSAAPISSHSEQNWKLEVFKEKFLPCIYFFRKRKSSSDYKS